MNTKELTVSWQAVPADALSHEGSLRWKESPRHCDLTAQLTVRVSEKDGRKPLYES